MPVGKSFANTLANYDTFSPGPWVDADSLSPFQLKVDQLDATFEENVTGRGQFGSPRDFTAHVTTTATPTSPEQESTIKVNHPLEMDGAGVFLLGNGYAPVITVRDAEGDNVYSGPTPFLAQDNNYTSVGVVKVHRRPAQAARVLGSLPARPPPSARTPARSRSSRTPRSRPWR